VRCLSLITFLTILGETISSTTTQGKTPVYYTKELSDPFILHFDTYELDHRLLSVSIPLRCDPFGVQPLILTSYFPFHPSISTTSYYLLILSSTIITNVSLGEPIVNDFIVNRRKSHAFQSPLQRFPSLQRRNILCCR
jgi:hypothetical protein